MHVGLIGAGMMGHGMAANLLKHGHQVTVIAHRNRSPVDDLVARGAREAASLADIAQVIANDHALTPSIDGLTENFGTQVQLNETDLGFLRRLLARVAQETGQPLTLVVPSSIPAFERAMLAVLPARFTSQPQRWASRKQPTFFDLSCRLVIRA